MPPPGWPRISTREREYSIPFTLEFINFGQTPTGTTFPLPITSCPFRGWTLQLRQGIHLSLGTLADLRPLECLTLENGDRPRLSGSQLWLSGVAGASTRYRPYISPRVPDHPGLLEPIFDSIINVQRLKFCRKKRSLACIRGTWCEKLSTRVVWDSWPHTSRRTPALGADLAIPQHWRMHPFLDQSLNLRLQLAESIGGEQEVIFPVSSPCARWAMGTRR